MCEGSNILVTKPYYLITYSLVPRLSRNEAIRNFNVRVPERGSLGTRLNYVVVSTLFSLVPRPLMNVLGTRLDLSSTRSTRLRQRGGCVDHPALKPRLGQRSKRSECNVIVCCCSGSSDFFRTFRGEISSPRSFKFSPKQILFAHFLSPQKQFPPLN